LFDMKSVKASKRKSKTLPPKWLLSSKAKAYKLR
jgi:hypothetical protein